MALRADRIVPHTVGKGSRAGAQSPSALRAGRGQEKASLQELRRARTGCDVRGEPAFEPDRG